jgi:hypothetical protein
MIAPRAIKYNDIELYTISKTEDLVSAIPFVAVRIGLNKAVLQRQFAFLTNKRDHRSQFCEANIRLHEARCNYVIVGTYSVF